MENNKNNEIAIDNNNDYEETMLTTLDNPFNPFKEFDEWFAYDSDHGYHTCSYLARIVKSDAAITEQDVLEAIATGIDEILSFNLLGNYCKITRDGKRIPGSIL